MAYYKEGQLEPFVQILELSGKDANLDYSGYEKDQVGKLGFVFM